MSRKHALFLIVSCFLFLPVSAHAVTHNVNIGDNFFSPNNLTITVGDTVHWSYNGGRSHDATADDGTWGSPTSSSIDFSKTFNSVEEVLYFCTVHSSPGRDRSSNMNGRINVIAADENQSPTANFNFNCTDLDCDFTDTSSDSDGTISSRSWDFDDDGASSAQNPSHSYAAAGTYTVSLTAIDNDGAEDSINRIVTVSESLPDPIVINIGMTDAWFNPATDGQGMLIIVWEDSKFMFLAWFTFDTERPPEDVMAILGAPGQRWLTASGPYDGDTATLDVFLSSGGTFDSPEPPVFTDPVPYGTITIKWSTCNAGILAYNIPSLGLMRDIPITRIVTENVPICEAGQPAG
jgi:PKD repeat protein